MRTYIMRALVVLMLAFGVLVSASADEVRGAFKFEGAWVAKVQAPGFGQWSYVLIPDSSGRHAAGHGTVDVGFRANFICGDLFEPSDAESPILVSVAMTGPDTGVYNAMWYGLKDLGPASLLTSEIVLIGTTTGTFEFVAPGEMHGTHNFALYTPDADADGDGYPDEAADPVCVFTMNTVDTRLPLPE
jgi:hypothetical protein